MTVQDVKLRFGIIGNDPKLIRAINTCIQVAPTTITTLILGESGTGKEVLPKVIHQLSQRKHGPYIAVNCGAIPDGTIDSELFGHEKGAFTGAQSARKGYFEAADGGTIFLDEVAELPMQTQVRLLRVLETGEFLRVGSSRPIKTDVRVVAATNVNIQEAIRTNKFREDLFYRFNQVQINIPPLRERKEDIHLLFRKFAQDFSDKYRMPTIELDAPAVELITKYPWPGNIRQLKNIAEQISVLEEERKITASIIITYLPQDTMNKLPMVVNNGSTGETSDNFSEREILYKVLFDMKNDLTDLKTLVLQLISGDNNSMNPNTVALVKKVFNGEPDTHSFNTKAPSNFNTTPYEAVENNDKTIEVEEVLSLADKEKEMIEKALVKHRNKRKYAAKELGISERTLYRKIKEYNLK